MNAMASIIGRKKEVSSLNHYMMSGKAEFVALYGRRRVGKTYLITNYFKNSFAFDTSGILEGSKADEMEAFYTSLQNYGYEGVCPKKWMEAFNILRSLLEPKLKRNRVVVFIDELPCFDTPRSGFVKALDYFWNTWASRQSNFFLIVCGSATSWIVRNLIDGRGGLHNRVTHEMHLHALTLKETEMYLKAMHIDWDRMSILRTFMVLGGIPYYLNLLRSDESPLQNIDRLFWGEGAELKGEYNRLYKSLFKSPERYMTIVKALAKNKQGLSRKELVEECKMEENGHLSGILDDLVNCDFIRYYNVAGKESNGGYYQLVDFYTHFYLDFGSKHTRDAQYWSHMLNTPRQNTWYGLAFERVCLNHVPQILHSIGIDRIQTDYYSWRSRTTEPKSQIDLIIDRADGIINLCEMKYSADYYAMTASEAGKINTRLNNFISETFSRKGVQAVLVTTLGLKQGKNADIVRNVVTLDDLFK